MLVRLTRTYYILEFIILASGSERALAIIGLVSVRQSNAKMTRYPRRQ
jgi:hypothetical protein